MASVEADVLTWDILKTKASNAKELSELIKMIRVTSNTWPESIGHWKKYKDQLSVDNDGTFGDRPVIPMGLEGRCSQHCTEDTRGD